MLLVARGEEQVKRCLMPVVVENGADRAEQRALAVASGAVSEKQAFVARVRRHAVAERSLQERQHLARRR